MNQPSAKKKPSPRSYLRWIYICILHYTGMLALATRWVRSNGAIVLTFHRVLSDSAAAQTCSPAASVMKEQTFEALLRFVREQYFIFDLRAEGPFTSASRIPVAVTFDDGCEDNASIAFPVASRLQVPFTVFICPELMNTSMPFWPEQIIGLFRSASESPERLNGIGRVLTSCGYPHWAIGIAECNGDSGEFLIGQLKSISSQARQRIMERLLSSKVVTNEYANGTVDRTMSWAQVTQLHSAGVSFGSHTQHHEILTMLPVMEAELEIRDSKAAIEARLANCSLFSYPNGDVSPEVREIVARCGFRHAFTNSPGVWREDGDPYLIPRINLSEETVTNPKGEFSPVAFQYRVFWNAFVHRTKPAAESWNLGHWQAGPAVEKFNSQ